MSNFMLGHDIRGTEADHRPAFLRFGIFEEKIRKTFLRYFHGFFVPNFGFFWIFFPI